MFGHNSPRNKTILSPVREVLSWYCFRKVLFSYWNSVPRREGQKHLNRWDWRIFWNALLFLNLTFCPELSAIVFQFLTFTWCGNSEKEINAQHCSWPLLFLSLLFHLLGRYVSLMFAGIFWGSLLCIRSCPKPLRWSNSFNP